MEEFVVLYHDYDLLVIPIAFIVFFIMGRSISHSILDREDKKYFNYGLIFKMLACIGYGLVVQYYFRGGDTNRYYIALNDMKDAISDDPANLLHIYGRINLTTDNPVAAYIEADKLGDSLSYMVKTSNYMVPRFGLLFSFLFGRSYTAISMCYSFFAFWGCWKCFKLFAKLFPTLKRPIAIAFLFFPSVVYWGSAIMKDSVCLGSLGLFVYCYYCLFFEKKNIFFYAAGMILWGSILFFTKPYLLLALIPGLSLWFFLRTIRNIKEKGLRYAAFGILLVVMSGSVVALLQFMLSLDFLELDKYKGNNLILFATSAQEGYKEAGGSVFDIGTLDGSLGSFLQMFPKAVNASLFRPYLWEVKTPPMFISAVESAIIFYMFLYGLVKLGFRRFFATIFNSPVLVFMFIYSIFLGGLVAITTNNFGSLVRYKIVAMPFFVVMLFIVVSTIPEARFNPLLGRLLYSRKQRKTSLTHVRYSRSH